jgi:hypothetical protein
MQIVLGLLWEVSVLFVLVSEPVEILREQSITKSLTNSLSPSAVICVIFVKKLYLW